MSNWRGTCGYFFRAALVLAVTALGACEQGIPKEALQITPETLEQRQLQTRRFDTSDEAELLSASAALLQDLGFNLDESETDLGVIVASKDRDARPSGWCRDYCGANWCRNADRRHSKNASFRRDPADSK
jgi:hypothetical protein